MSLLIVAYLFLGGAGAGAFAVLSLIDAVCSNAFGLGRLLVHVSSASVPENVCRRHLAHLVKRGYAVSFVALFLGALCLLADLGRPEIAYMLFTRPTLSYISVGTYALTALMLCVLCLAVLASFVVPRFWRRAKPIVLVLGFGAALFVMAYTGVLLQSMSAVPLWRSPLLIVLFVLSSLSTGIALVLLCSSGLELKRAKPNVLQRLAKLDFVLIVLELAVCAVYLGTVSSSELGSQSASRLLGGDCTAVFALGFVFCGALAPAVLDVVAAVRPYGERIDLALACLLLVGGFCLRLSIVNAGIHSSI